MTTGGKSLEKIGAHESKASPLYVVKWKNAELPVSSPTAKGGVYILMSDDSSTGVELERRLTAEGYAVVTVLAGKKISQESNRYSINPLDPAEFSTMVNQIIERTGDKLPLRGIVHLWSLENKTTVRNSELTSDRLLHAQQLGVGSVLHTVQAMVNASVNEAKLILVTRGAQSAAEESQVVSLAQAPMWGIAKVIALEHPELKCLRIDLDPSIDNPSLDAECIVNEARSDGREDQIAFRAEHRKVARLNRASSRVSENSHTTIGAKIRGDGTYLISGGLGALGLHVTEWLVDNGAKSLVLIGRSGANAKALEAIVKLQNRGVEVRVECADVCIEADVVRVIASIGAGIKPLRGVIHAAGLIADASILRMDSARMETVLAPKVLGGWNLHKHTASLKLDFFTSFSSIVSLLGNAGQANYAAANAFLDSLAFYQRQHGIHGISINWGPWDGLGMVESLTAAQQVKLAQSGLNRIPIGDGLKLLSEIIVGDYVQVGVIP